MKIHNHTEGRLGRINRRHRKLGELNAVELYNRGLAEWGNDHFANRFLRRRFGKRIRKNTDDRLVWLHPTQGWKCRSVRSMHANPHRLLNNLFRLLNA